MTSEEIRLELFKKRKSGVSISSIARSLNPPCSRQAVSAVIDRGFISNRIMKAVAEALDRDVKYVFPEYFLKKAS